MLKNPFVRIALVIGLVILLYYLVITLGRSTAGAEQIEDVAPVRGSVSEPR